MHCFSQSEPIAHNKTGQKKHPVSVIIIIIMYSFMCDVSQLEHIAHYMKGILFSFYALFLLTRKANIQLHRPPQ